MRALRAVEGLGKKKGVLGGEAREVVPSVRGVLGCPLLQNGVLKRTAHSEPSHGK